MDNLKPIRTEEEYASVMREIDTLLETMPEPGTSSYDRLDALTIFADAYERAHADHRIDDKIDAVEAIQFHLDRLGRKPKDLASIIGCPRSRAWEILNRKRALTLPQIRALVAFGVPVDRLVAKYELASTRPVRRKSELRSRDSVPAAG